MASRRASGLETPVHQRDAGARGILDRGSGFPAIAVAAFKSIVSLSSTTGYTTNALPPRATSSRRSSTSAPPAGTTVQRERLDRRASGRLLVQKSQVQVAVERHGGLRGVGVAVSTRRCALEASSASVSVTRWRTPKRCLLVDHDEGRDRNARVPARGARASRWRSRISPDANPASEAVPLLGRESTRCREAQT